MDWFGWTEGHVVVLSEQWKDVVDLFTQEGCEYRETHRRILVDGDLRPLENSVMSYLNTIYKKPTGTFDGVTECFILEGNPPVFVLKEFINNF